MMEEVWLRRRARRCAPRSSALGMVTGFTGSTLDFAVTSDTWMEPSGDEARRYMETP